MSCCKLSELASDLGSFRVDVDVKKNRIDSNMILSIINEITIIHNLLVEDARFMAGCEMGRLQGDLVFLMKQFQEKEKTGDRLGWMSDIRSK
jgi:hypothetical protein